MRFNNIAVMATIGFLAVGMFSSVRAANTATASLTIEATFTKPTCTINVPASYDLGELVRGQLKEHESLSIKVECPGAQSIKTALTAKVLTGTLENTQDKVQMIVNGKGNGTLLSFKPVSNMEANIPIKLTGATQDAFCSFDSGEFRQCQLIPVTEVHAGDTPGHASASVLFDVIYP
ncbi:fimbrial protein [Salmonella enterica]|nr:fimbrial protein [Salmonella enterica]ECB3945189.1 fimbrial protein [Salmonella enterica subsp. enterica serovar Stanley]